MAYSAVICTYVKYHLDALPMQEVGGLEYEGLGRATAAIRTPRVALRAAVAARQHVERVRAAFAAGCVGGRCLRPHVVVSNVPRVQRGRPGLEVLWAELSFRRYQSIQNASKAAI